MKLRSTVFPLLLTMGLPLFFSCSSDKSKDAPQAGGPLKLWYNEPASAWEEAIPIGNGRMGAMVFGNPAGEHLQINEETVWAGEPGNNLPAGFIGILPQLRELLFQKEYIQAEALLTTRFPRHAGEDNNYGMPYQTAGDLQIEFPGHENPSRYYRELDISRALAKVTYEVDGVVYSREYLASQPDQVMAIRLGASEKGKLSFSMKCASPHESHNIWTDQHSLFLSGNGGSVENKQGKVEFMARFHPVTEGGSITITDSSLVVEKANSATVYISIGTNFIDYRNLDGDAETVANTHLEHAIGKSYGDLKEDHIQNYRRYFDRVVLDLGSGDSIYNPTDQRIKDFSSGVDPQLAALYFQFGRYLLISSSFPGTQPANLQGIWNHHLSPPWDSKYTVNINTEMNYWPAELTNLPEMHTPLFSMLRDLSVTGQEAAKEMYGARGWMLHHNTDLWRITGPVDGAFYGMWPMGGAWLSQHIWQHYLYSGDKAFLEEFYPVLEGIATFYADVLQEEPDSNWLVVSPSMSPENRHPGGTSLAPGNTMDNQLVFDVFTNLIRSTQILGKAPAFADTIARMRDRLPPMQIGRHTQLQEWLFDWDRVDDSHRHVSHLYGLYPGNQISPYSSPELFQAARNSLEYRGDKSTGWSMGWKVNLWARLLDGNRAYQLIQEQLSPSPLDGKGEKGGTYPNLFDAHPPFQIDGNFGCTAGIAEMLLQSHDEAIHLLPALPDAWQDGYVKGLRARGGFTIEMRWQKGRIEELSVHSALGGNCRLRMPDVLHGSAPLSRVEASLPNPNPLYRNAPISEPLISEHASIQAALPEQTLLFDLETEAGERYHFTRNRD